MEREVRAASDQSRVRDGYLGALGYSVFAYVDGDEMRPTRLRVDGPAGWPVFSTLAPTWPVTAAPVEARAPDFYALADAPDRDGPARDRARLSEAPVPLYLAAYSEGAVDLDRVGRLATTAFWRVVDYFGTVPFAHYTVHQELLTPLSPQHEYGMSMEHLSSSTYYLAASSGLTSTSPPEDDARVLYNFAHHMAHAWVPKRVYGHGYFPFQWELAPVLDSIWFAEGFGQYAAIMAIAAGTADPGAYREGMLNRRFRSNISTAPAVPQAPEPRRSQPRRIDALCGGLSHRPARVLARRTDGGRHRRSDSVGIEGDAGACATRCGSWWPGARASGAPSRTTSSPRSFSRRPASTPKP